MQRDLQIHTEDIDRLRTELRHMVEYFRRLGCKRCEVFFGWAWRTDRDGTDLLMKSMDIPPLDLIGEIQRAEDAGLGGFGRDDVTISFEGCTVNVQFCHHRGVHLQYTEPDDITRHLLERWRTEGLDPTEFERSDDGSEWRPILGGAT